MEYIDVLNENGVKTGEIVSREEIHLKGLWHRAVAGVIVNSENKVLMQQRSIEKEKFGGLWDLSVAGHISSGEDPVTAINRELNEEVGYLLSRNVKLKDCRFLTSFRNHHEYDYKDKHYVENLFIELFVIQCEEDKISLKFNDSEVQDVKWMDLFEIKKLKKQNKLHPRTEWIEEVFGLLNRL